MPGIGRSTENEAMMSRHILVATLCFATLGALRPEPAGAQWQFNGVRIVNALGDQLPTAVIPDGSGGAVAIGRTLGISCGHVWAQRVTGDGFVSPGWPDSGVVLSTSCSGGVTGPVAIPDGTGGALVAWKERIPCCSGSDLVFMQRVTGSGSIATGWPAAGLSVSSAPGWQRNPVIASDGAGGAFCFWDNSSGVVTYQRFTAGGAIAAGWPAAGRTLGGTHPTGSPVAAIADGSGGAYVGWTDYRDMAATDTDVYVLRITSEGVPASGWPDSGVAACAAPGRQGFILGPLVMIPDGSDGLVILWPDGRNSGLIQPYAQRLTGAGTLSAGWPAGGVALSGAQTVSTSTALQYSAVADGSGGAIAAWTDWRAGFNQRDIYAQHVGADGGIVAGWPTDGLVVCDAGNAQYTSLACAASDDSGGAFVAWADGRSAGSHIYALRIGGDGTLPTGWPVNGIARCVVGTNDTPMVVADGATGLVIVWGSWRNVASGGDVFADRIPLGGAVGVRHMSPSMPGRLRLSPPRPSPAHEVTVLTFDIPGAGDYSLEIFDLAGRRLRTLFGARDFAPGSHSAIWNGKDDRGAALPDGIYLVVLRGADQRDSRRIVWLK